MASTPSSRRARVSRRCSSASPPAAERGRCTRRRPRAEQADALLDQRLAAPFTAEANDVLYQWDSSRDSDPSSGVERINATVFAINAADDARNPAELGLLEREIRRVPHGSMLLIPASPETAGHGTTGAARFYSRELGEVLRMAPRLGS